MIPNTVSTPSAFSIRATSIPPLTVFLPTFGSNVVTMIHLSSSGFLVGLGRRRKCLLTDR